MVSRNHSLKLLDYFRRIPPILWLATYSTMSFGQVDGIQVSGVCAVANSPIKFRRVSVRGVGGFSANGDGFLLVDRTCGISQTLPEAGERWGQVLLVVTSESVDSSKLRVFKDASNPVTSHIFQIVAHGELTCRKVARKGDSATGSAFGSWGLIPCRLVLQSISEFHEVR
jgi:hypothetical protein